MTRFLGGNHSLTRFITRPLIRGTHGVITAGHYLATMAGLRIMLQGGNAIDAGVAAGFALNVLEPHNNSLGGETPILIYSADESRVFAINGQGPAPKAATIEWFRREGIDIIPDDGLLPATVPATFDAWITALSNFGTMTLEDVIKPALELAEKGFPMYESLREVIIANKKRFLEEWPTTAEVFLPNGEVPELGELVIQKDLARTFKRLIEAERCMLKYGRGRALKAARNCFYKGEIAEEIIKFIKENKFLDASGKKHSGLLSTDDFAEFKTKIEEAVTVNYKGYQVFKCGPWTQGPVFLQQLNLLEGFDLEAMGHNSADYIHIIVEAAKLAFADREKYYADPEFVDVPLKKLLSKEYAAERRKLIDLGVASKELRPGEVDPVTLKEGGKKNWEGDTTHLDVIDRYGNMISATPSGAWIQSSPIIKDLGFPLGTRGQMFHLDTNHAEALAPRRRPSATLTPSLVMKDGKPFMVFGTPGGDRQDQWTLQFFLNFVEFNMNLQEAIDAPTFHILHFPSSFYPHDAHPNLVAVEERISKEAISDLKRRGHIIQIDDGWSHGRVQAVMFDQEKALIVGGASPRSAVAYAAGW